MTSLIKLLIIAALAIFIYIKCKKLVDQKGKNQVGKKGEDLIANVLRSCGVRGTVKQNVYVTFNNGKYTEIDLLFITDRGIYVIESKNYSAIVFGTEMDNNWTAKYYNGNGFQFYNPILQNAGHANALVNQLGIPPQFLHPIVVFGAKTDISNIRSNKCIKVDQLAAYINQSYNSLPAGAINTMALQAVNNTIETMCHASPIKKYKHIKQVQRYKY